MATRDNVNAKLGSVALSDNGSPRVQIRTEVILLAIVLLLMPARLAAQTFGDVPTDHWAHSYVEDLVSSGLTSGCGGGKSCPDGVVTRAQMAVFLERGMKGSDYQPPAATGNVFLDVRSGDFAAGFIEQLSNDGITAGCGSDMYCPGAAVSRAQMAVFLLRAKHGAGFTPGPAHGVFADVDLGYWAVHWIEQLAAEGITAGCGSGKYCPEAKVTRAQMAVFLVRAFDLKRPTMSSVQLIEAALAAGKIGEEQAIIYQVYATFSDPRLPQEYRGNDSELFDSHVFDMVYEKWDGFTDDTKATLLPFLIPPAYVGSSVSPAVSPAMSKSQISENTVLSLTLPWPCARPEIDVNWKFAANATGGRFKVWYDSRNSNAQNKAQEALTELETHVWPTLIDQVGFQAPLSDGETGGCNGGDARLDVYLVPGLGSKGTLTIYGLTGSSSGWALSEAPVYIRVGQGLDSQTLKAVLAHEFTHATQWAYDVKAWNLRSYQWLKEATATWAVDAVYKDNQFEHQKAPFFLETPDLSLEDGGSDEERYYGSYLFFQFLARTYQPQIVAKIWAATRSYSEQIEAVNRTIPDGFKKQWSGFAKRLWNKDPVDVNSFKGWDGLPDSPKPRAELAVALNARTSLSVPLDGNLKHLATHYYKFNFTDPNVRSFIFYNHAYAVTAPPDFQVSTQAFILMEGGEWQYEHWSDGGLDEDSKFYCLDVEAERIKQLVIAISNDHPTKDVENLPRDDWPRISASNVGCWKYVGTSSLIDELQNNGVGDSAITTTDATEIIFERWQQAGTPPPGQFEIFTATGGNLTSSGRVVTANGCTITRSGTGHIGWFDGSLTVNLDLDDGNGTIGSRLVSGSGSSQIDMPGTMVCPDYSASISGLLGVEWLYFPGEQIEPVVVPADGLIEGSYVTTLPPPMQGQRMITWRLSPRREP